MLRRSAASAQQVHITQGSSDCSRQHHYLRRSGFCKTGYSSGLLGQLVRAPAALPGPATIPGKHGGSALAGCVFLQLLHGGQDRVREWLERCRRDR